MTIQFSTTMRTDRVQQIEDTIGASPTCEIRTGAQPASCAAADSGSLLVTINLPADWATSASGVLSKSGTWQANASAGGTAGHFRIKQGATCHMQGSCGIGTGDLQLDNTNIANGQQVTITAASWTDGNP